jgi:hypothetical protein
MPVTKIESSKTINFNCGSLDQSRTRIKICSASFGGFLRINGFWKKRREQDITLGLWKIRREQDIILIHIALLDYMPNFPSTAWIRECAGQSINDDSIKPFATFFSGHVLSESAVILETDGILGSASVSLIGIGRTERFGHV